MWPLECHPQRLLCSGHADTHHCFVVQPPYLYECSYAWQVTEGECYPMAGWGPEFQTTLLSEGGVEVQMVNANGETGTMEVEVLGFTVDLDTQHVRISTCCGKGNRAQCPMGGETCLGSLAPSSPLRVSARLNVYIRASEDGKGPRSRAFARQSDPSRTRQASSLHPLDTCIDAFRNRNELRREEEGYTTEQRFLPGRDRRLTDLVAS